MRSMILRELEVARRVRKLKTGLVRLTQHTQPIGRSGTGGVEPAAENQRQQ